MVEITNVEVYGLEKSLKVSGYPMRADMSKDDESIETALKRGTSLAKNPPGSGHPNFLKGIIVQFDIKFPQYFSMQLQRYHWAEIVSSQSKMHRLVTMDIRESCNEYVTEGILSLMDEYKSDYVKNPSYENFMRLVSNLPMGFEMTMGITTNYLQLKTIFGQREDHKLAEDWGAFCNMIRSLPHSYLITKKR